MPGISEVIPGVDRQKREAHGPPYVTATGWSVAGLRGGSPPASQTEGELPPPGADESATWDYTLNVLAIYLANGSGILAIWAEAALRALLPELAQ